MTSVATTTTISAVQVLHGLPRFPGTVGGSSRTGDRNDRRSPSHESEREMGSGRGRGRGRGRGGHHRGDPRRDSGGRGHERRRGWVDRGRGDRYGGNQSISQQATTQSEEPCDSRPPRSLSPTSLAIARATGQRNVKFARCMAIPTIPDGTTTSVPVWRSAAICSTAYQSPICITIWDESRVHAAPVLSTIWTDWLWLERCERQSIGRKLGGPMDRSRRWI